MTTAQDSYAPRSRRPTQRSGFCRRLNSRWRSLASWLPNATRMKTARRCTTGVAVGGSGWAAAGLRSSRRRCALGDLPLRRACKVREDGQEDGQDGDAAVGTKPQPRRQRRRGTGGDHTSGRRGHPAGLDRRSWPRQRDRRDRKRLARRGRWRAARAHARVLQPDGGPIRRSPACAEAAPLGELPGRPMGRGHRVRRCPVPVVRLRGLGPNQSSEDPARSSVPREAARVPSVAS